LCERAITAAEQAHAIPGQLLGAIGRVETGRQDAQGKWRPWPWTINAEGVGSFFETKAQAIAAVRTLQARGVVSIDVRCMQVNLMHHPTAFANLDQAFDPASNADYAARYAARFLQRLYAQTNDWTQAAAQYYSSTPALAADYRRKVMNVWAGSPASALASASPSSSAIARAWSATLRSPFGLTRPGAFAPPARLVPAATLFGGATPSGRGLDAYRAMPIAISSPQRPRG
jgi:hypothetical protein